MWEYRAQDQGSLLDEERQLRAGTKIREGSFRAWIKNGSEKNAAVRNVSLKGLKGTKQMFATRTQIMGRKVHLQSRAPAKFSLNAGEAEVVP
jgi:hypothetical protein